MSISQITQLFTNGGEGMLHCGGNGRSVNGAAISFILAVVKVYESIKILSIL